MKWLEQNLTVIWSAGLDHLILVLPAIAFTILISVPVAYFATRRPRLRELTLTSTGLLYAIPSLPLFVLIPVLLGVPLRSNANVYIVLTIYGCSLLVRAAADAFDAVDADVLDAATAMGYGRARSFFAVHLPLAGPAIIAGVRVVAVTLLSLTTVSAVLGVRSLGSLFTDGFQRGIVAEVLAGILATVVLALLIDLAIVVSGRLALPHTKTRRRPSAAPAVEVAGTTHTAQRGSGSR